MFTNFKIEPSPLNNIAGVHPVALREAMALVPGNKFTEIFRMFLSENTCIYQ